MLCNPPPRQNNHLIFKYFLIASCALLCSTEVWAFGGIGLGKLQRHKSSGVDAIGVHIDSTGKKANINFTDGDNAETAECSGNGVKGVDDNCYCHQGYTGTNCETKLCESGSFCGMDGDNPLCCPSDHICTTAGDILGTCWKAESGCTVNADCESGEFCNLGTEGSETPVGGTCEAIGDGIPSNEVKDDDGNVVFAAGQFLASLNDMNWWSARNWCKAQGRQMVQLYSLHISIPNISDEVCHLPCQDDEECECDGETDVCKPLGSNIIMNKNDTYWGYFLHNMRVALGNNENRYYLENSSYFGATWGISLGTGDIDFDNPHNDAIPSLCE